MPSLHEIEKALCTLWLNHDANTWLQSEASLKKAPPEVANLDPAILAELDRKGASVYARSLDYEYQNMADCIFPYCAKAIGKDWDDLVVEYYKIYPSRHFDFNKVCLHFSDFLREHGRQHLEKYPYLTELADYEWLELEKAEDATRIVRAPNVAITGLEQITEYFPVVNQTLTVRHYRYPIVEIAENFEERKRPKKKFAEKACRLAIYRDPDTHGTRFIQLGEATAAVIEMAQRQPTMYQDLLKLTISLTPELPPAQAVMEFLNLLEGLHNDNIFVGSHRKEVKNVI